MYRLCEVVQVDSVEMEQIIAYEASRGRHPGSKLDRSSSRINRNPHNPRNISLEEQ